MNAKTLGETIREAIAELDGVIEVAKKMDRHYAIKLETLQSSLRGSARLCDEFKEYIDRPKENS